MNPIFYPLFAMVLLTFLVWACLVTYRVTTLMRKRVHPQAVAVEAKALEVYKSGINLSDNFENLFEVPVLFYVAALAYAQLGIADPVAVNLAWAFVALRAAHTVVHSTSNIIRIRFALFLMSSICVWAMWLRIVTRLI